MPNNRNSSILPYTVFLCVWFFLRFSEHNGYLNRCQTWIYRYSMHESIDWLDRSSLFCRSIVHLHYKMHIITSLFFFFFGYFLSRNDNTSICIVHLLHGFNFKLIYHLTPLQHKQWWMRQCLTGTIIEHYWITSRLLKGYCVVSEWNRNEKIIICSAMF